VLAGAAGSLAGVCGPFTDVSDAAFCPFVLEIFTLGITTGTTPTSYDPTSNVTRLQMAAFLSRTVDGVLKRGSRRAALRQFWDVQNAQNLLLTVTLGAAPSMVEFDGADLWVSLLGGKVGRVRASDGKLLETWTGVNDKPNGIALAMGRVFIATAGQSNGLTGRLMQIDPAEVAGAATTVATNLPQFAFGLAFDGGRFWTTNLDGTVSIVTPGATVPWTVTTTAGGYQIPNGILYDGSNVWITDLLPGTLLKLNASGGVLQTVTVGDGPNLPVFDGSNIWVPNQGSGPASASVSVVRASSGAVLATLTGNGLTFPVQAAFDGQRILVTNQSLDAGVSLWKAADLTPLGTFPMPASSLPFGACGDGVNFWITLASAARLARF
jgi:hypothetical protein